MQFQEGITSLSWILPMLIFTYVWCDTEILLQSKLGLIRGIKTENKMVYQFRGIPYGKPPIGDLRFSKPQPYGMWNDTLNATHFPPSCMQFKTPSFKYLPTDQISEDCLYLNIYVPRDINNASRKSVMVWIHGGGFGFGQASGYDGTDLTLEGDVIVVTINYRVGVFGFLSSGDSILPGNYGLWDQRLAIMWLKDHIADFGGNPLSITIVGGTAGGMSATFLALSPLNEGLFQRAIFQSGTGMSRMSLMKSGNLNYFGNLYNCSHSTDSLEIINCLRQVTADKLIQSSILWDNGSIIVKLGPIVDGELILNEPGNLLSDPNSKSYKLFRSIDIIIGTTNAEGSAFVINADPFNLDNRNGMTPSELCDIITPAIARDIYSSSSSIAKTICDKYKVAGAEGQVNEKQGMQVVNLYTDLYFITPAVELLNVHSNKNVKTKAYEYSFEYEDLPSLPMPPWLKGAIHGADFKFVFGLNYWVEPRNLSVKAMEQMLSTHMMKYWTNFAKTGNPNQESLNNWPEYKYKDKKYLEFGADGMIREKAMLNADNIKFWFNLNGKTYTEDTSSAPSFQIVSDSMIPKIFYLLLPQIYLRFVYE